MVHGSSRVITGEINDEQLRRVSDLAGQDPAFKEILHGPTGYKSPYRTIEQIAQDRKSGVIAPSNGARLFELLPDDPAPPTASVPKTAEPVKLVEAEVDNATRLAEERIRIT